MKLAGPRGLDSSLLAQKLMLKRLFQEWMARLLMGVPLELTMQAWVLLGQEGLEKECWREVVVKAALEMVAGMEQAVGLEVVAAATEVEKAALEVVIVIPKPLGLQAAAQAAQIWTTTGFSFSWEVLDFEWCLLPSQSDQNFCFWMVDALTQS